MSSAYVNRARGRSFSQQPSDEELTSIDKQFEYINMTFKYSINDLDSVISMLRARYAAEDAYLTALYKVRKMASNNIENDKPANHPESQLTFQNAVKLYESTVNDMIEGRQRLRDAMKMEIENLVKQKEQEEHNRKTFKNKLAEANINYTTFRNREIVKLHKTYTHKCEDLKISQSNFQIQQQQQQQQQQMAMQQQQQQQQQYPGSNMQYSYDQEYYRSNRNSADVSNSRLSGDYGSRNMDNISNYNNAADQHKKAGGGMAGLISQMRTRAAGSTYMAPPDQNKQITKVAKMKKEIAEADAEYREGILVLENLRKKQTSTTEEVNRQLKNTLKRKTEAVKNSLTYILQCELETLKVEVEISSASYAAAANIDSARDSQIFSMHYQSLGYIAPTPVRYENFYLEGKCREVLFSGSLETYAIEHNRTVPLLVTKCIEAIESMGGLQKEGIYRVSGRQTSVEQLKHQFELDEDKVVFDSYDVFTIATVLKMYIRELKRPLFDFNVQTRSSYSKNMPQNQRFNLMETKLSNLSLAHRSTLHCIIRHLSKVNANSQINKMNIPNLAMIFTPVIFHDFNQSDEGNLGDWSPDDLFEDLILNFEFLFPISEENARKINEPKLNLALNGKSPYSQFSQSNLLYLSNTPLTTPTPSTSNTMLLTQPINPSMLMNSGLESPGGPNSTYQQFNYPPKLTTIIGTAPPSNVLPPQNHQRKASLQQSTLYSAGPPVRPVQQIINNNPAGTNDSNARITPTRYQLVDTANTGYQPPLPQQTYQQSPQQPLSATYQQPQQSTQQAYQPPPPQQQPMKPPQVGMNRSTSDTTVLQRGSSMMGNPPLVLDMGNHGGSYGYIPTSISNNNSPLPTRTSSEGQGVPILTKRNSSAPLQQQQTAFVKSAAPPRQDSLRKPNPRFQSKNNQDKTILSETQSEPPVSATAADNQQQLPPLNTDHPGKESPEQHEDQQPYVIQPYSAGLHQDFVLPPLNEDESNLESLLDFYSPTDEKAPALDPTHCSPPK